MRVYKSDHCGKFGGLKDLYKIKMQPFPPFVFVRTKHLCEECYRIICELLTDSD